MPRLEHQDLIARRQGVHQAGLPGARPRRGKDDDRIFRLEDSPAAGKTGFGQRLELGPPVVDGRFGHGPENALRHIGRPGNLEKMTTALIWHDTSYLFFPYSREVFLSLVANAIIRISIGEAPFSQDHPTAPFRCRRSRKKGRSPTPAGGYSGMLLCFFSNRFFALFCKASKRAITFFRVSRGTMISSMMPSVAAKYGLLNCSS